MYFLGPEANSGSGNINEIRKDTYADEYFMSQLPTSNVEGWRRECFVSKAFFDLDPSSSYSHAPSTFEVGSWLTHTPMNIS
jgi:hypothetical protein